MLVKFSCILLCLLGLPAFKKICYLELLAFKICLSNLDNTKISNQDSNQMYSIKSLKLESSFSNSFEVDAKIIAV